jgi:hypothetical protein
MKTELKEVAQRYLASAGGYGLSVPLASLGFSKEEIEEVFGAFDEDYHISRFFHFACAAGANFQINGFPQTHVSIDEDIRSIL